jgi:hypothetical protein
MFTFAFKEGVFNLGDEVQVTGVIDQYNGKTEIVPADSAGVVVLSTGNPLPDPQVITIADVGEDYESELVRLNNVWLVDPSQWPSSGSNANLDLTDGVDTVTMRIDKETDIDENAAVTGTFNLIAVGGQYDNSTPPDGGYQVLPRFYTDFISPDPSILFFDDFEAYTAGLQLALQNPTAWTPWSGTPGAADDPIVSDAYAFSGSNSVLIVQNDDIVKDFGVMNSGAYAISFEFYIPTGQSGYFNTLAEFTLPGTFNWGMECYFDVGGGGRVFGGSGTAITFAYANDTWNHVEVIVNLETDMAKFLVNGTMIHEWQWTLGATGGGSPLQLDANDFFGAAATDEMYFDDYMVREISPAIFFDDFDSYTAGVQLALQNPVDWTTWGGTPGGADDPFVSDAYSYSGSNSVVIVQNDDLVKLFGSKTSGVYSMSFMTYIPTNQSGYFNTLAGFAPNPNEWGMECYFNVGGAGSLVGVPGGPVAFTFPHDTWFFVETIVDLDQDLAELHVDGVVVLQWQWTQGGTGTLRLDANDFFGAAATDEMYFDDYTFDVTDPLIVGINDLTNALPITFDLQQNYPNPFNPTTTIKYQLPKKADVKIVIYNMLGQVVRKVVDRSVDAGYHEVVWDGLNESGSRVATGVYIYRMETDKFVKAHKMIMMK